MKHIIFTLSLVIITGTAWSKPVTQSVAKLVGTNFIAAKSGSIYNKKSVNLTLGYSSPAASPATVSQPAYYIFNSASGFVIISGDDAANPVLAYSNEGSFDPKNISPSVSYWLAG